MSATEVLTIQRFLPLIRRLRLPIQSSISTNKVTAITVYMNVNLDCILDSY